MKHLARKTRRDRAALAPFAAALLAALPLAPALAADAADFARCVDITVAYAPGEALADFPALVRLGPSILGFDYGDFALANGGDLRFLDANGNVLAHEIDTWNPNGTSLVWVRLPTLANGAKIRCCYGNAQPGPAPAPSDVWSKYIVVVHGGAGITNSVGNAVLATAGSDAVSATADSGILGGGVLKTTANAIGINLTTPYLALSSSGQFSVSGWFRRNGNGGSNNGTFILGASRPGWTSGTGYLWLQEQGKYVSVAAYNTHQWGSGKYKLADQTWGYVAFAYDKPGKTLVSYFNGVRDQSRANPNDLENTSGNWSFGSYANTASGDSFVGSMDELRIYDGVAGAAWIAAEHATVADGGFLSFSGAYSPSETSPLVSKPSAAPGYTDATLSATVMSLGAGATGGTATIELAMDDSFSSIARSESFAVTENGQALSAEFRTLAINTTYYARTRFVNNLQESAVSAAISFTTVPPGPVFSATIDAEHIAPSISLAFTSAGFADSVSRITVLVSTSEDFTRPEQSRTFSVNLSAMPTNVNDFVMAGLPLYSPVYYHFIAENSNGYQSTADASVATAPDGNNVWSGLSEDISTTTAYVFQGGLPAAGRTLFFTSPAGLSPIIDEDATMPSLRFTSGSSDSGPDTSYLKGYHSCGYDLAGSGVLTFTAEKPIWHGSKGTNVVRNPILFSRNNSQTVYVYAPGGRLDLTGELTLPFGVTNTTMRVNGDGGEVHFGGPSPDFMGRLYLESSVTLSLDSPFAMTNVNRIFFGGGWGAHTYLKNNTGAPMVFPRCETMDDNRGDWQSTRVHYTGAPFIFPVGTLNWAPRSAGDSSMDADMLVKNLKVSMHGSNSSAVLYKNGVGLLAIADKTEWDANSCKHMIALNGGCFWAKTSAGLPPTGEFYVWNNYSYYRTLGLGEDYRPKLDGSSTPRVFQSNSDARWGFTGFGGDRIVCWNADPTLNLTNTTSGNVAVKLTDTVSVNEDGNTYSTYYAYPACFVFGNRSEFADGTILFQNPIRYELGQNWDTSTFFESTNRVVAARMRGSLKLGNKDKTWNFSGRNFGGYLALEADNSDFTGKVNVTEKGNLLVNSNLVARSATVQAGSGLGGTGSLDTADGTTVQSGGALFGGEWNKGGCLTLGGKVTFANGSALRAEIGSSNDRVGFVKLAPGSTLKLTAPIYVDVDTDPRVSPIRGVPRKLLDWSEASFDSGSAPTRADFVARPESNSDIRSIYLFVEDDALWVNYASVRTPPPTVLLFR